MKKIHNNQSVQLKGVATIGRQRIVMGIRTMVLGIILSLSLLYSACATQSNVEIINVEDVDYVYPIVNGYARVFKGSLDEKGEPKSGKYGYIDISGNVIVEPTYEYADDFDENGYAGVCQIGVDRKWGLVDTTGTLVVPCKYSDVGTYSEGLVAAVTFSQEVHYLDLDGNVILCFDDYYYRRTFINDSMNFVNGYAILSRETGSSTMNGTPEYTDVCINKNGKVVARYGAIWRTTGDYYLVRQSEKYGVLDSNLSLVMEATWDDVSIQEYNDRYFLVVCEDIDNVEKKTKRGLYDLENKFFIVSPEDNIRYFDIVNHKYCLIRTFTRNSTGSVEINNPSTIVSITTGEVLTPFICSDIKLIHDDIFLLESIDTNGAKLFRVYDALQQKVVLELEHQQSCSGFYKNGVHYIEACDAEYNWIYYACFAPTQEWNLASKLNTGYTMDGKCYLFIRTNTNSILVDSAGERIELPLKYEDVLPLTMSNILLFDKDEETCFLYLNGKIQKIAEHCSGAALRQDGTTALLFAEDAFAYIDENGRFIGRSPYFVSWSLLDYWPDERTTEWLLFEENGCVGVTDRQGRIMIPAEYDKYVDQVRDEFIMQKGDSLFYLRVNGTKKQLDLTTYTTYKLGGCQLLLASNTTAVNKEHVLINIDGAEIVSSAERLDFCGYHPNGDYSLIGDSSRLYFCTNSSVSVVVGADKYAAYEWHYDCPVLFQWGQEGKRFIGIP